MKIIVLLLLLSSLAFSQQVTPNSGGGCQWFGECDVASNCRFNASPAIGCENLGSGLCSNCYRGGGLAMGKSFDPANEFAGKFVAYSWQGHKRERLIITTPGVLAASGVAPGDVVSRFNGIRVTRELMLLAPVLKGQAITVYKPGHSRKARRVRLD